MLLTTHRIPGLLVRGHQFDLPLAPNDPVRTIRVFAREVVASGRLMLCDGGRGTRGQVQGRCRSVRRMLSNS